MTLDINTVKKNAKLANIEFPPEELEELAEDMKVIVGWIEKLQKVNTDDTNADWLEGTAPFRDEKIKSINLQQEVLQNTKSSHGCFVTPKVIE